ncbi:hypothetical protein [Methylobacterium oryzae]|uniref:Uncharacterized protein n=1 Tax=Methylobacterium oryzae TaxID=334852 RepID=A0ABU7TT57_9HYPH
MRSILLLCTLLLLPSQAWALCRCICVRGVMRPICQQTDLVEPICQGLCEDQIRPATVVRPLAGGQQVFSPVELFDPAFEKLAEKDPNVGLDTRGNLLGTTGVQAGADALSRSAQSAASA